MADYAIPKNGAAYIFYGCLVSQADTKLFKSAPTLAAGDFKVSIDGGAFANLATLPTNTPGTFSIKFSLSGAEMTGDNILVVASDAAGAEWCDQCWNIQTSARGVAELATDALLTTVAGYLDTEIAAIKAKTDNLPTSPAAVGSAMTLTSGERDSIATALLKLDWTGITGEAARSMLNAARFLRNKWSISGTTLTVTKEDDTTAAWTSTVTATAGADPITGNDPA